MPIKPDSESETGELSWLCIKVAFGWFWFRQMVAMITSGAKCIYPVGICKLYNFDFLFSGPVKWVLVSLLIVTVVVYVKEKYMLFTTGFLTLLSLIIISHHESTGILLRATPYTVIFAVQFLAYFFAFIYPDFNLALYRRQYAIQIIAATYTLSAISKLSLSGIGWVNQGTELFSVPVMKGFSFLYFDTGDSTALQKGQAITSFAMQHKDFLRLLLGASLFLETCCFLVILHRKLRMGYGVALLLMHAGISYAMNIFIGGLAYPMIVFFINPLYWLVFAFKNRPTFFRRQS